MELGIQGRWALVTGSSKGLGFGCAQALAREGVNLVVNGRSRETLNIACEKLKRLASREASITILGVEADITTPEGRDAVFDVKGGPGRDFDILVTNSGGPPMGDFREWDRDIWLAAIEANMLTPIELIKATVDGMADRGFGRIINITSSAVRSPIEALGLSNGARSGLTGFMAGLARSSIASKGVTINNILPGKFDTDRLLSSRSIAAKKTGKPTHQLIEEEVSSIPVRRLGKPEEFGAFCAFLCSVHASYINGQNLLIDGGMVRGV